jgi:hypothetical protein
MHPDDRVLVGIINRKRDLDTLLKAHWYRIPQGQMQDGVYVEYLAFYLSGYAAKKFGAPGVYYYAARQGVELTYRRDLLPDEGDNPRANEVYYKVQFSAIDGKHPPIMNPTKRPVSFIFSTWDRFVNAKTIADLYSKADYYVDRIYHALRDTQMRPMRFWDAQKKEYGFGAALRFVCEAGTLTAYTDPGNFDDNSFYLDVNEPEDKILLEIRTRIASMGGMVTLPISPTR